MSNKETWSEAEGRLDAYLERRLKPTGTCPECAAKFSLLARRAAEHIECPACKKPLRVGKSFYSSAFWLSVAVLIALAYFFAGPNLLGVFGLVLLAFVPVCALVIVIANYVWPPTLESREQSPLHNRRLGD
jgi:uncharacterized paraquat-inducible protein A